MDAGSAEIVEKTRVEFASRSSDLDAHDVAVKTLTLARRLIATSKVNTSQSVSEVETTLLDITWEMCTMLQGSSDYDVIVTNMALRVRKLIRDDCARLPTTASTSNGKELRRACVATLGEYLDEVATSRTVVAAMALRFVRARDTVVTLGYSKTVVEFIRTAAAHRRFGVRVATGGVGEPGARTVADLKSSYTTADDPDTTVPAPRFDVLALIHDTHITQAIAKAHVLVLSAHCILAHGGFVGASGAYAACLAARRHSVPVVVCACAYKLTPKFQYNEHVRSSGKHAARLFDVTGKDARCVDNVATIHADYEYVPPEMVSLYLCQPPGLAPSYVYRALSDHFSAKDIDMAA